MRIVIFTIAMLSLAATGGGMALWSHFLDYLDTPKSAIAAEDKTVFVPEKTDARAAVDVLVREGLVARPDWLAIYVERFAKPIAIKPGEYSLSAAMSPRELLLRLQSGRVLLHTVAIERGAPAERIVDILANQGLGDRAALTSLIHDVAFTQSLGIEAESLEGYLFPDVYALPKNLGPQELLGAMVERFKKVALPEFERAAPADLTVHQWVTLASLVEVSNFPEIERRHYAGLLKNRLKWQIQLEIDQTLEYGLKRMGIDPAAPNKTEARPWNTRVTRGLPPGPITNPGLESLVAALDPAKTRSLYATARPDGTHVFCDDLECRDAAEATWSRRP